LTRLPWREALGGSQRRAQGASAAARVISAKRPDVLLGEIRCARDEALHCSPEKSPRPAKILRPNADKPLTSLIVLSIHNVRGDVLVWLRPTAAR